MDGMSLGPTWGIIAIGIVVGVITLGCFILMFKYLAHPGERDPHHPKYDILRRDR